MGEFFNTKMPSNKNIKQLQQITQQLETTPVAILVDYAGLTVSQQQNLKKQVKEVEGEFKVTKNTLLNLALKDKAPELLDSLSNSLQGQTAVIYAPDPVSASKVVAKFQKENENLGIKIGFTLKKDNQGEDKILTTDEIFTLSKLPGREELLAILMAQLNAPISTLTRLINSPTQYLVFVVKAIQDKSSN